MIHKLLEIFLDLALGPQRLTSLDVQEAECIDVAQSVEELRLGEGNFRVIRGLPERDTGLQGKGSIQSVADHHPARFFTYDLGGDPLDWDNPENVPYDIQSTPLATNELV